MLKHEVISYVNIFDLQQIFVLEYNFLATNEYV